MVYGTLAEIGGNLSALDDLLEQGEGEMTPELTAWMEEYATQQADKLERIAKFWRDLELHAAALKTEEERLYARRKVAENKVTRLKGLVLWFMQSRDLARAAAGTFTFRRQASGGKQRMTILATAEAFPAEFLDPVPASFIINGERVRAALEAGTLPAGLAQFEERGEGVRLV